MSIKPLEAQTPIALLFMTESKTTVALYFDQEKSKSIAVLKTSFLTERANLDETHHKDKQDGNV